MNLLDIILGTIFVFAFVQGMRKGLFVSLASFIGLILGVIGAIYFSEFAASYINNWFSLSEETTYFVAKAVTFISIVFIINWAGKILTKLADFAFLVKNLPAQLIIKTILIKVTAFATKYVVSSLKENQLLI